MPFLTFAALTIVLAAAGYAGLRVLVCLLPAIGMKRPNYLAAEIPTALGLLLGWTAVLFACFVWTGIAFWPETDKPAVATPLSVWPGYLLAVGPVLICGWLDDRFGDKRTKGWRGHFRKLRKELVPSTAWLKAAAAFLAAWMFALRLGRPLPTAFLDALLISLAANALNLLDLRPGRALKAFMLGSAAVLTCTESSDRMAVSFWLLYPFIIGGLLLLPFDLRARGMLGDTGANALGFALGSALALALPLPLRCSALALLVLLHLYAENHSLTRKIESVKWLRWLDELGRRASP